jgi:type IV pilus assembly protein PilC
MVKNKRSNSSALNASAKMQKPIAMPVVVQKQQEFDLLDLLRQYLPFLHTRKKPTLRMKGHAKSGVASGKKHRRAHRGGTHVHLKHQRSAAEVSARIAERALQQAARHVAPRKKPLLQPQAVVSQKKEMWKEEDNVTERIFSAPAPEKIEPHADAGLEVAIGNKAKPDPIPVISYASKKPGFFSRLQLFFAPRPQATSSDALAITPPKEISTKKEVAPMNLDSLLGESLGQERSQKKPELPNQNLVVSEENQDGLAKRVSVRDEQKQIAPVGMETAEKAPEKKKGAALPVEAAKPVATEKPKETPKEKPATEIVYKAKPKHEHSSFADFMGALKYFGIGKERHAIVQNLATMLNAGLPLIDSIKTLLAEARNKSVRALLARILELVENGSPLWRAMDDQHFFSPHAIALIRIGEEAGNLAENMEYLSIQQEKDQGLRSKVKMAMIYPAIVMVLMFVIIIGLGMFVLPNLITVLFSLNVPLPLVTRIIVAFTQFFTEYGKIAIPGFIAGGILLTILCKFTPLSVVAQWILFRIPGVGSLVREATIARFGVILGGLLKAGVPLTDSLRSLAEVTPIASYRALYYKLLDHIIVGDTFGRSFQAVRGSKLLPVSVQQLVITGEKSGSLAPILLKIADIYEKKANNTAERLPVILEPILLLFIGGLVGTIALAIIVPIYSIVGNVAK